MDNQLLNTQTGELSTIDPEQRQDLLALLRSLARGWPHTKMVDADAGGPSTLGLFVRALQLAGITAPMLQAALGPWFTTKDHFPWSPKELIDFCLESSGQSRRLETALEAWGKVGEGMKRRANFKAVHFRNPITARLVEAMGGLAQMSLSEESVSDRARFIEAYNQLAQRAKDDLYLRAEFADHSRRVKEIEARQEEDAHATMGNGNPDDEILDKMGYIFENGHWRKPTREENIERGYWREGVGRGMAAPIELDHNDPAALERAMKSLGMKFKMPRNPATLEEELNQPPIKRG